MAWSNKTNIMSAASVAASEQYSSAVSLNPGELAHVEIDANFPASPSDDLTVNVYGDITGGSPDWDDTPLFSQIIDNGTDPNKISLSLSGLYQFRVGTVRSGSSDTIVVSINYRKDGVSL